MRIRADLSLILAIARKHAARLLRQYGTAAALSEKEGDVRTYILTGDRDSLQLVSDSTTVVLVKTKEDILPDVLFLGLLSQLFCSLATAVAFPQKSKSLSLRQQKHHPNGWCFCWHWCLVRGI